MGKKKSRDGLLQTKTGNGVPGAGFCSEWTRAKMLSVIFGEDLPPFTSPNFRLFFQAVSRRVCMVVGGRASVRGLGVFLQPGCIGGLGHLACGQGEGAGGGIHF